MRPASRRPQAGHLSTYLMPWLAGAAIVGGLGGAYFKTDPVLAAVVTAAAAFGGYVLLEAAWGMYSDYAMARKASERVAAWVPGGEAGLALQARVRLLSGSESEIHGERDFAGSIENFTSLGIDVTGRRLALGSGEDITEVAPGQIRRWRRAEGQSAPARRLFVLELAAPVPRSGAPVERIEVTVRSPADAAALDGALRRALGEAATATGG